MKEIMAIYEKVLQVGIVTKDISRILQSYVNIFGIGPWYILKFAPQNVESMTIYNKRQNYSMNVAVCPIDGIRFEYIEPITDSIFTEFYNKHGENLIHHLKFQVKNYKEALNLLTSKNFQNIQSGEQKGDKGKNIYTFIDTEEKLGFITEIVNVTSDFIKPKPDYLYPSENKNLNPIFIKPTAIGILVKNIEAKIQDYENLSISPWKIYELGEESNLKIKMRIAFCKLGNVILKLIEPKSDSIFSWFLENYGEGIHHIKMEVDDYDRTLKYLKSKGINVIYSDNYLNKIRFTFLDTHKHLNFITEISNKTIEPERTSETIIHP